MGTGACFMTVRWLACRRMLSSSPLASREALVSTDGPPHSDNSSIAAPRSWVDQFCGAANRNHFILALVAQLSQNAFPESPAVDLFDMMWT